MLSRLAAGVAVSLFVGSGLYAASLEKVGQPCRAFNCLSGRVVKDGSGTEYLALMNMNEKSGSELLLIDFTKNTGRTFRAPAGAGAWALLKVPDSAQLVAGTFYDGSFMDFDLSKMAWQKANRAGKEEYIWSAAMGSDGRVYGGTYPGAHLAAVDPKTMVVEDIARPDAAAPNLYLRLVSSTPDGRILCAYSTQKPTTMLYDPKTKSFSAVPKSLEGVQSGLTWNGYFVSGNNWDGKAAEGTTVFKVPDFTPVNPPPFPVPPGKGSWRVDTYASTGDTLFIRQGEEVFRYKTGDSGLTKVSDGGFGSARFIGCAESGTLLGLRGQDYAVQSPGSPIEFRPIPVEGSPRSTHFLRADGHGRLWGGPTFGQTVFYVDTKTGKTVNTSQVCNSGGEVYDAAFIGEKTYLVAYAGGDVIEFDPSLPWDQAGNRNPRTIAHLHDAGAGYIRPNAGVSVGADGKLYSGWLTVYGKYGGAVSVTDPATGKTDLIENPLGAQGVSGVATDGTHVFVGTTLGGNGLPTQPGSAQFGVVDLASKKVPFRHAFEGIGTVDRLVFDPASKTVAFTAGGAWYLYTPGDGSLRPVDGAPKATTHMLPAVHGGRLYYGGGTALISMELSTGKTETVLSAPSEIDTVTADPDGVVYVSCGVDVYRVRR